MTTAPQSQPDRVRARWFMQYVGECPLCGRDKSYREARYTDPPPKAERYTQLRLDQTYDYCDVDLRPEP